MVGGVVWGVICVWKLVRSGKVRDGSKKKPMLQKRWHQPYCPVSRCEGRAQVAPNSPDSHRPYIAQTSPNSDADDGSSKGMS